jgi:hypothetical protein
MLTAAQMQSLPSFFSQIPDPRRAQGRRHRLSTVLGIAAGAVLCGMRGYRAISDWAQSLGQKSRERFGCRRQGGRYLVPSEYILRDVLIRVAPPIWTAPCNAGTKSTRRRMRRGPSTARPCAMPSTKRVTPRM